MNDECFSDCQEKTAVKVPEVQRELNRLAKSTQLLKEKMDGLSTALKPVLGNELPQSENCSKEESCESGLAKEIRITSNEIIAVNDYIDDLLWRIRCKAAPYSGGSRHPNPEEAGTLIRFKAAGFCEVAERPAGMAETGAFIPE